MHYDPAITADDIIDNFIEPVELPSHFDNVWRIGSIVVKIDKFSTLIEEADSTFLMGLLDHNALPGHVLPLSFKHHTRLEAHPVLGDRLHMLRIFGQSEAVYVMQHLPYVTFTEAWQNAAPPERDAMDRELARLKIPLAAVGATDRHDKNFLVDKKPKDIVSIDMQRDRSHNVMALYDANKAKMKHYCKNSYEQSHEENLAQCAHYKKLVKRKWREFAAYCPMAEMEMTHRLQNMENYFRIEARIPPVFAFNS